MARLYALGNDDTMINRADKQHGLITQHRRRNSFPDCATARAE